LLLGIVIIAIVALFPDFDPWNKRLKAAFLWVKMVNSKESRQADAQQAC